MRLLLVALLFFSVVTLAVSDESPRRANRGLKGMGKGSKGSKSKKGSKGDDGGICFPTTNPHPDGFDCDCKCCLTDGPKSPPKGSKGKAGKGHRDLKGMNDSKGSEGVSIPNFDCRCECPSGSTSEDSGFENTIFDFVKNNPELTSLAAAVVQAGLVENLTGSGSLTLFAPSNDAFGALPSDLVNTLLTNDEFIPQLADLLLYHVLSGEFFVNDLFNHLTVTALNRENLLITLPPIAVNGNKVVSADNDVTNGVVHVIEGVLTPAWVGSSLTDRVVAASDLSTLLSLVILVGIEDALAGPAALTVVAPTNSAFAKLPQDEVDFLTSPNGKSELVRILLYHVFSGIFTSDRLQAGAVVPTLQGGSVTVSLDPVKFNDSKALEVDVLANNGVLHKIDTVLDPNDSSH